MNHSIYSADRTTHPEGEVVASSPQSWWLVSASRCATARMKVDPERRAWCESQQAGDGHDVEQLTVR
jgi:hypothetical protein